MTFQTNFKGAINLPSLISTATNTAMAAGAQQVTNFLSPSAKLKQTENLQKLSSDGAADKFTQASSQVNLSKSNGQIIAVDQSSNSAVALQNTAFDTPASSDIPSPDDNLTDQLKVTISQSPLVGKNSTVVLDVMPTISETRSASYDPFSPVQHPGDILKYRGTNSRTWSVSARLVSRTSAEATENLKKLNAIRSWVMPFYGVGTAETKDLVGNLGGPPPILTLRAYGNKCIGPVPCVLEQYTNEWPNDCDYLPAIIDGVTSPFPVMMTVTLSLKESYSPAEASGFSLAAYKNGDLSQAFKPVTGEKLTYKSTQYVAVPADVKPDEPVQATPEKQPVRPEESENMQDAASSLSSSGLSG